MTLTAFQALHRTCLATFFADGISNSAQDTISREGRGHYEASFGLDNCSIATYLGAVSALIFAPLVPPEAHYKGA